jgi:Asp-tRNA(Asn)/Glu-tRNA(Gln) amidotransferase A subunit family amidase
VTPELALKQARRAEREIRRGDYRGPLHGIPSVSRTSITPKAY